MSEQAPIYTITTVNDFLNIPLDRMDDFFKGFIQHIKEAKVQREYVKNVLQLIGDEKSSFELGEIVWIDDSKDYTQVTLSVEQKEE